MENEIQRLQSINNELETALREAAQTITAIRAVNVTEFGTVSDAAIDRLCRSDNTADTLDRAESDTPAKHGGSAH